MKIMEKYQYLREMILTPLEANDFNQEEIDNYLKYFKKLEQMSSKKQSFKI